MGLRQVMAFTVGKTARTGPHSKNAMKIHRTDSEADDTCGMMAAFVFPLKTQDVDLDTTLVGSRKMCAKPEQLLTYFDRFFRSRWCDDEILQCSAVLAGNAFPNYR